MATNEERIEAMEMRIAALEYAASPQAAYERGLIAFPGEVKQKVTDADDQANPPAVMSAVARKLAWIDGKGWFVIWVADNIIKIAPVRKAASAMVFGCITIPAGSWVYGAVVTKPDDYKVVMMIRNPWLPDDCGC